MSPRNHLHAYPFVLNAGNILFLKQHQRVVQWKTLPIRGGKYYHTLMVAVSSGRLPLLVHGHTGSRPFTGLTGSLVIPQVVMLFGPIDIDLARGHALK